MPTPAEPAGEAAAVLPPEGMEVWQWFCELQFPPQSNGFGPVPISFQEIFSWAVLSRRSLTPWEVRVLRALSHVWLAHVSAEQKKKHPTKSH
jgi:hypothetical protein